MGRPATLFLVILTAVIGVAALSGCKNSILRNLGEAGIETVREGPLPTPTAHVVR